jgi:hypothetical protein
LVHTYEEVDVPATLANRLVMIGPAQPSQPVLGRLRKAIKRWTDPLFYLQSRLAGGSALVFATVASLLIGFSDDMTFAGIYRQAHVKAAAIYDRGVGIYSQKEEVAAQVEMMGTDLGEAIGTMVEDSADSAGEEKDRR